MSAMRELQEEQADLAERQRELEEEAFETLSHRAFHFAMKLLGVAFFGRKAEESDEPATA